MILSRRFTLPAVALLAALLAAHAAPDAAADQRRPRRPRPGEPVARPPSPDPADLESLIEIRSREELLARRRALTRLVFGTDSVPEDLRPTRIDRGFRDRRFHDVGSLGSIDRLTYVMDHGIDSVIYHLKAEPPAGSLVIYHHGHHGGFEFALDAIESLLAAGHDVLALSMPLEGMNSRPLVTIDRVGTLVLRQHGWIFFLDRPLGYFMEPIAAALNHGLTAKPYSAIAMAGFSGGGWATTLYAAMDQRIQASYPVAGSMPNYLRAELLHRKGSWDQEQHWIPLLREANYLEMYVMGASGKGRKQVQILIQGDTQVSQANRHGGYERAVAERVRALGPGEFRVFVDVKGSRHRLTEGAVAHVVDDLGAGAR